MASLSLPRVLQLKKNSLDAEREQFEKFQTLAIQKAINSIETPVKEKHVRSTLIGTFQEQSAVTYWMVAIRLPLQENRIVAWKFCNVTHKLLREGHPVCLDDSQRHIGMIENLGKLWVHLREGYGRLVHLYTNLLVCKLKFHARNPRFPGNMQLTADELDAIAENDVNNYFQLCVELFDYMDDILSLQAAVFDSLGNARANSMTASGQCRLAALIPCAQDSSQIYDCNVRLLFRLHAALPADTLAGHRERFRQQFRKLSSFYKHASSLQYYRNLLTLPVLPSNPPNFLLQSDFGMYVPPVVSIPEPAPDEPDAVAALVDTSDAASTTLADDDVDTQPDLVLERDRLIEHLQNELKRCRTEVSQLVQERNTMLGSMREHCTRLESQLQTVQTELEEEKQKSEILAVQTPEIKQKLTETEEKAKVTDEKFQKLKGAYTQLREEHITLIRQKAEVDKLSANLRAAAAQHESAKTQLQQELNDRLKDVELLQQSASSSEEIEAYQNQISNLRSELEQSRQKEVELNTVKASLEALEIEHKTTQAEQEEKINTIFFELKEATETLQRIEHEKADRETELIRVKEELVGLREKSGDEYKRVVEEKETALKEIADLKIQHQQEKEELTQQTCESIDQLQIEIDALQQKLVETESNFAIECEKLNEELTNKHNEFEDNLIQKDVEIKEALENLNKIQNELEITKFTYEDKMNDKTTEIDNLQKTLIELIESKNNNETLVSELTTERENIRSDHDIEKKNFQYQITILEDKLKNVTESKDEIINNLKSMVKEKDEQVINLNVETTKLSEEVAKLSELLEESQAELEIGKNELFTLKEEHDGLMNRNETNLLMKNQELRNLHDEITELKKIKTDLENKRCKDNNEYISEKKVLDNKIVELNEDISKITTEYNTIKTEKEAEIEQLSEKLTRLQTEFEQTSHKKDDELKLLEEQMQDRGAQYEKEILVKDEAVKKLESDFEQAKTETEELQKTQAKEKEELQCLLSDRDKEKQILEARLEHTEEKRLNAECELQDLLQHNSALEADLAAARILLEEARAKVTQQNARLVTCASEVAVQMTSEALTALEVSSAHDSNQAAAQLATDALEQLSRCTEVKGNEETIAKSALTVAHNTAQLSAYVTEVSQISTDMEQADKLNNECRSMLLSTKECLESLTKGSIPSECSNIRSLVRNMASNASAADTKATSGKSVDDELADMDTAIEEAASQIEELLATSRASASGIQLEVNEKILDACTTLMAAVRVLVQDSRKLQQELGDPKTRQKMYRKNPQWSEGLISASKAVVFAAKLLVSSADEAVSSGGGRVEGVSAAAHEVAGATAQLTAASRARAPPAAPALARLTAASRAVAAATGALVAAVRAAARIRNDQEALDTSALSLTATRRLEMESKVRALELETALDAERARLAALHRRHYQLAAHEENGNVTNGKE